VRTAAVAMVAVAAISASASPQRHAGDEPQTTTTLGYHRFGPRAADAMTVRTATFRAQLDFLGEHGHHVVRLSAAVDFLAGRGPAPPAGAVVITVDDGHRSVFDEMLPIVRDRAVPVTLFVYPSAISNATYAMTWTELASLRETGLFDIESHTYWHPNFKLEKRRLDTAAYHRYEIVRRSLEEARRRTGLPAFRFRPWLQVFRDYAFGSGGFSDGRVRRQIGAAESVGTDGWMLWNPRNEYARGDLAPKRSASAIGHADERCGGGLRRHPRGLGVAAILTPLTAPFRRAAVTV